MTDLEVKATANMFLERHLCKFQNTFYGCASMAIKAEHNGLLCLMYDLSFISCVLFKDVCFGNFILSAVIHKPSLLSGIGRTKTEMQSYYIYIYIYM